MDVLHTLLDFILHVDQHLRDFVTTYDMWVYALLFAIIFIETGVVVMPFLPGDSLLFVVGTMCGIGLMSFPLAVGVMFVAAVAGNQSNYTIGRLIGHRVFKWEHSRFFNKAAFVAAHDFYERHGGFTIVAARFMPFLRTFAPFVAGVAEMSRAKFTFYDVTGGILWVVGVTACGYFFGNIPFVKTNLDKIIWAMLVLPAALVFLGGWRAKRKAAASARLSAQ